MTSREHNAQAAQPAEPKSLRDMTEADFQQAHGEQPAEPVAHVVTDIDGGNKRVCFYSNKALYETPVWAKLYAHPDPRIAALTEQARHDDLSIAILRSRNEKMEGLLREVLAWGAVSKDSKERIEAALGGK